MTEFIQVSTSVDTRKNANRIARELLEERVASCVQVFGPIKSSYWWKGKKETAREWVCLVKARARDYWIIEANIKRLHPYEIPEITAVPLIYGNLDYLNWIRRETTRKIKRAR